MCQVFFNARVYAKQKINLTWPNLSYEIMLKPKSIYCVAPSSEGNYS